MSVITALFLKMGKVVPYFKMTPELANQLHSYLGKIMMYAKSSGAKLTKQQQDYIMDQTKQLDLYEKSMTPPTPKGPKAEIIDLSKKLPEEAPYSEKNPKGWMPSESEMIELGNPSVAERTGGMLRETKSRGIMSQTTFDEKLVNDTIDLLKSKTDEKSFQDEIKKIIGRKGTYEDYSDAEIKGVLDGIEADTKKQIKSAEEIIDEGDFDPSGMKDGGRIGYATGAGVKAYRGIKSLMDSINKKFGKGTIKTAEEIDRPEKAKLKEMFDAFNERFKKKTSYKQGDPITSENFGETPFAPDTTDLNKAREMSDDIVKFRTENPAGQGRFTKAEAIIARLENTIKNAKENPDETSDYVLENFPNMIEELRNKPELANNENVWKELGMTGLPENQRFKIYDDDTVDFQTLKPTHTFKLKEEIKRKLNANGGLNYLMGL